MKQIVFLFSGQGSQYYGMARELFYKNQIFRESLKKQDKIVKEIIGVSVIDQIYDPTKNAEQSFDRLLYTHPAGFMVQFALFETLLYSGVCPDHLIGMSLGEFVAAAASNAISLHDALSVVTRKAEIVENECQESYMYAILDNIGKFNDSDRLQNCGFMAISNYNKHFVVSIKKDKKEEFEAELSINQIQSILLPIRYGFHSPLVENVKKSIIDELAKYNFRSPEISVTSCMGANYINKCPNTHFWNVMRQQIDFIEVIKNFENKGSYEYFDIGPSGTMGNFVKYNLNSSSQSKVHPIITAFGNDIRRLEYIQNHFSTGISVF